MASDLISSGSHESPRWADGSGQHRKVMSQDEYSTLIISTGSLRQLLRCPTVGSLLIQNKDKRPGFTNYLQMSSGTENIMKKYVAVKVFKCNVLMHHSQTDTHLQRVRTQHEIRI